MTTIESMRVVARHFNSIGSPYAFLGASILPLIVDHAEVLEIRPTIDVDLSIEIATLGDFYKLEDRLRAVGFRNDTREGAPICRWVVGDVTVDVMPTEASVLGMASEWFREAVRDAKEKDLGDWVSAPVIRRPYFLATKLTAYRDRGAQDPYLSKDLEDIVTLFNGCEDTSSLVDGVSVPLQQFIVGAMQTYLESSEFADAVTGCFRTDSVSRERAKIVRKRMRLLVSSN